MDGENFRCRKQMKLDPLVEQPDTIHDLRKDHDRIEIRQYWMTSDLEYLANLRDRERRQSLKMLAVIASERRIGEETEIETRFFFTSLQSDTEKILKVKCSHWGIENRLYWGLHIVFAAYCLQ